MSGFDVMLGNPPFLGGQKLTGAFGQPFREFLVNVHAGGLRASADLCAYFFLVAFASLRENGRTGLIATNSIAQGNSREISLSRILAKGGSVAFASRDRPWTGDAAVIVNIVTLKKGKLKGPVFLDGNKVEEINEYLSKPGSVVGNPYALRSNKDKAFQGSILLGDGFLITPAEAQKLIQDDHKNSEILFPYLNGKDLNSVPDQTPSRWCINFLDMPIEQAMDYPDIFKIVEEKVKFVREKQKDSMAKKLWWIHLRRRAQLYNQIVSMEKVLAITRVSKVVLPVWIPAKWNYSEACVIFALDSDFYFGIISSQFHWWWAQRYASSLKGDTRYTPTVVFEKLPIPPNKKNVSEAGKALDNHRAPLMIKNNEGLTKTYNRVHDSNETDSGIQKLRELHRDLDIAVRDAYGWSDLDLDHGFHQTKQGMRWTLGPEAQREVLDLLLALNHERYAEEVKQGLHD